MGGPPSYTNLVSPHCSPLASNRLQALIHHRSKEEELQRFAGLETQLAARLAGAGTNERPEREAREVVQLLVRAGLRADQLVEQGKREGGQQLELELRTALQPLMQGASRQTVDRGVAATRHLVSILAGRGQGTGAGPGLSRLRAHLLRQFYPDSCEACLVCLVQVGATEERLVRSPPGLAWLQQRLAGGGQVGGAEADSLARSVLQWCSSMGGQVGDKGAGLGLGAGRGREKDRTDRRGGSGGAGQERKGQQQGWNCHSCNTTNNDMKRGNCYRCSVPRKPADDVLENDAEEEEDPICATIGEDWVCSKCRGSNWCWRGSCFKCRTVRFSGKEEELRSSGSGSWELERRLGKDRSSGAVLNSLVTVRTFLQSQLRRQGWEEGEAARAADTGYRVLALARASHFRYSHRTADQSTVLTHIYGTSV